MFAALLIWQLCKRRGESFTVDAIMSAFWQAVWYELLLVSCIVAVAVIVSVFVVV